MRIIAFRVGKEPSVEMLPGGEDKLAAMQKFVGGYVECIQLTGNNKGGIDIWCNEEYLLSPSEPNRKVGPDTIIHGDFFVAAHDGEGNSCSLSDLQCAWVMVRAASWQPAEKEDCEHCSDPNFSPSFTITEF